MKQLLLLISLLTIAGAAYSQKIVLHRNTGGDQVIELSSIDSIKFLPFECGDNIRYESKTYQTVLVGSQCWFKQNLDVGIMLEGVSDQTNNGTIEKFCYDDDSINCETYGGLYQWNEAMQYTTTTGTRGICPSGWHIPTQAQLQTLQSTVIDNGNALKEIGQGTGGGSGTNTSGFSALLAGYKHSLFASLSEAAFFWSSNGTETHANYLYLLATNNVIGFYNNLNYYGISVRCLKD